MSIKPLLLGFFLVVFLTSIGSVDAATGNCGQTVNSKNTVDFLKEIPSINDILGNCNVSLPSAAGSLLSNGNIMVNILMTDGSTEQFDVVIINKQINRLNSGTSFPPSYNVYLNETTLDKILQSSDIPTVALVSYNNGEIKVVAVGFVNKIKFFFAKFFIPKTSTSTSTVEERGKPANCDDTHLPGHRNYAENKALWDSYSAETDGVCQSQFGKGQPSPCVHGVQLSIDGNPYYLCWYNN